MRGRPNGIPTTTFVAEEDYEAIIIEREAAAFLTGKTDERIRVTSEELGIPFASLAARISQSLGIQGKRAAMSLLQVRRSATGQPSVLQPEMALAGRSHRLLPGAGETERAGSGGAHQASSSATPSLVRDIQQRRADGQSINSIAKKFDMSWLAVKKIIKTGEAPKPEHNAKVESIPYQRQRQIASAVHTARKNGIAMRVVAERYNLSEYVVLKVYKKFDYSGAVDSRGYVPLKKGAHTRAGGRAQQGVANPNKGRKLTPGERSQLAAAVAKALEKGVTTTTQVAKNYGVSWFTARKYYEEKTGKKLPKQPKGGKAQAKLRSVRTEPVMAAAAAG